MCDKDDPIRVESWYPWIKEHTFPTNWFSLTLSEAQAIIKLRDAARLTQQHLFEIQRKQGLEPKNMDRSDDLEWKHVQFLNGYDLDVLLALTKKIDRCINELYGDDDQTLDASEKPAFVRLSTRSPKDSALTSKKIKNELSKALGSVIGGDEWNNLSPEEKENFKIECFTRCQSNALRIESGEEAVNLLGNSQRVFHDLQMCMLKQGNESLDIQIIVRKWQIIDAAWEFRAFVGQDGEMTGCTQYYKNCYVPEMSQKKPEIESLISTFFSAVKTQIPLTNYSIDFVIDPAKLKSDEEDNLVKPIQIVELNHFPPVAGTSLFDWESAHDRNIIECGPFELRVLHGPSKQPLHDIPEHLLKYVQELSETTTSRDSKKRVCAIQ